MRGQGGVDAAAPPFPAALQSLKHFQGSHNRRSQLNSPIRSATIVCRLRETRKCSSSPNDGSPRLSRNAGSQLDLWCHVPLLSPSLTRAMLGESTGPKTRSRVWHIRLERAKDRQTRLAASIPNANNVSRNCLHCDSSSGVIGNRNSPVSRPTICIAALMGMGFVARESMLEQRAKSR